MSGKKYLYRRSAFRPMSVRLEHMDICIRFFEDHVEASNTLFITALDSLSTVKLDAKDLEIKSVRMAACQTPVRYSYARKKNRLTLHLGEPLRKGGSLAVSITSVSHPSDNILEGIYRDTTPPGAPRQYMSQCQQWGFQRIMPVFDDCTAKCTMITTLEGDARYTHLISNGNISRTKNPAGKPVPLEGDPSRMRITYENLIPMAPYLFIACAGTWDVLADSVTCDSGRTIQLEYLVPKGRIEDARIPMAITKDSILWHSRTQNYEYNRDVYRTICMEKSNFGGMENVGNTTIVTDAALIDDFISDPRLEYAHGVIIHEFEHNQCGSDVTMETPFDVWLNEAFTVDVERQYTASRFGAVCRRLDDIDTIRAPIGGPLSIEDAGYQGNIVRTGFNDPDELIDGVTYVKAAEVIGMLRTIVGEDCFTKGKDLYFSRYKGFNANTDQFFSCFEEVSGRDLAQFRRQWLHTIGYPAVSASWKYSKRSRSLKVTLSQSRTGKGRLFHVPVRMAAVGADGRHIPGTETTIELTGRKRSFSFSSIPEPAFMSFNRHYSFYGTFKDESASENHLMQQVRLDTDSVNRVEAMRKLTDTRRIRLIEDPGSDIDANWLELYGSLAGDTSLPHGLKSYLLRIEELSLNRSYLPFYRERNRARSILMKAAATASYTGLVSLIEGIDTYSRTGDPCDGLNARSLKNTVLRILCELDTDATHAMAESHLEKAWNMTDKVTALLCIQSSSSRRRRELMLRAFDQWKDHLNGYTSYLAAVASGTRPDVFDQMAEEEARPCFKIHHPSHSRALFMPMCANNRMLWTEQGQLWLTETVAKMSRVNDFTASRILGCVQLVAKMPADLKPRVIQTLQDISREIDASKAPTTAGRLNTFLDGAR